VSDVTFDSYDCGASHCLSFDVLDVVLSVPHLEKTRQNTLGDFSQDPVDLEPCLAHQIKASEGPHSRENGKFNQALHR